MDLKKEIRQLGLSQASFAEFLGVATQTVERWIRFNKHPQYIDIIISLLNDPVYCVTALDPFRKK